MIPTWGAAFGANAIFNSAEFRADLTHSAVPDKAAPGTTATFTRATTATVRDHEGVLRTLIAGEIGFQGARRIHNLINTSDSSENMSVNDTTTFAVTITPNDITPPSGYSQADKQTSVSSPGRSGALTTWSTAIPAGNTVLMHCVAKAGSGRYLCFGDQADANWHVMTLDTQTGNVTSGIGGSTGTGSAENLGDGWWKLILKYTKDITGGINMLCCHADAATNGAYPFINAGEYWWATGFQAEDVTAQTTQTAGEYVSVGVESAPYYHGSFVDGVKCFPTDLSGNPLPTQYTYDAVSLNGVAGTYVSTPDSVANSITGDIDIRVKVALADWTPTAIQTLVGKIQSGSDRSYYFQVNATTGTLVLSTSTDGTGGTVVSGTSTAAPTVADGAPIWVRVTLDVNDGAGNRVYKFYTSSDGTTWTQLGNTVTTAGATTIYNSISVVEIGSTSLGTSPATGKIYQAQIYNGIDGTLAVDFDASRYAGGTTLTGSTGETWTLQGNAVIHPTNNPMLGYLAEGARTNLCLQSNAFTTTWTTSGTPAATQNVVGPDGATSAWTLTDNDAGTSEAIAQLGFTLTAATYTGSIFVKKTTGAQTGYPVIFIQDAVAGRAAICTVDTTNGVATVWTAYTGYIIQTSVARCTSYNDDFWRIELAFTATATADWRYYIYPAGTANATQATGILDVAAQASHVFYGAQLNLGSFAGSYIATTTAAVTRDADNLTYSGGDIPNLKTLSATFKRESGVSSVGVVVAQSDGGLTETTNLYLNTATEMRSNGTDGGASQWAVVASNAYAPGASSSAALSMATNDIKTSFGGTSGTQDTSATIPTVTQLNVGHMAGSFQLSGNVGGIYGWTRNLSQSEVNAVAT